MRKRCTTAMVVLACAGWLGCGRPLPEPDTDAPPVYRFSERLAYAHTDIPALAYYPADPATARCLGRGWQEEGGEEDGRRGRWIAERRASVRFAVFEPGGTELRIRLRPYVRSWRPQRLAVALNGVRVRRVSLRADSWEDLRIPLPAEHLKPGMNDLALTFAYASARHRRAAFVESFALAGVAAREENPLQDPPHAAAAAVEGRFPRRPAPEERPAWEGLSSPDAGWRQAPGSVVSWRMAVPRGAYLRLRAARPAADATCRISLTDGERTTDLYTGPAPVRERLLSLAAFGGRRVEIEFAVAGTEPVAWSVCEAGGRIDPADLNVYLLTIDSLRADHTGVLGHATHVTPCLDRLAAEGVVFRQAWSASNESMPSFASILTGRYPQSHGLMRNGLSMNRQQWSLSRLLGRRGFRTAVYANWGILTWGSTTGKDFTKRRPVLGTPSRVDLADTRRNVFGAALNWVSVTWRERQFLWLQSQFLHMRSLPEEYLEPFLAPMKDAYGEEAVEATVRRMRNRAFKTISLDYTDRRAELSELDLDYWRARYNGAIRFTDDHLKAFWEGLKRNGLDVVALTVITSDHGTSLGELHRLVHTGPPYHHLLHVPLFLLLPGSPEWKGRTIDALVETVDIAPTVMDYLGLETPRRMQGASLLPLIRGERGEGKPFAFATVGRKPGTHYYALRNSAWAYWSNFSTGACLERLPGARYTAECVAPEHPEQAESMRQELARWIHRTADVAAGAEEALSEEVVAILKKSGYLESRE